MLTEKEVRLNELLNKALRLGDTVDGAKDTSWWNEWRTLRQAADALAFDPKIQTSAKAPEGRNFPFAKARRWRNKNLGEGKGVPGEFKVLPWFQPIDNESRIDFKCLLKDLIPKICWLNLMFILV